MDRLKELRKEKGYSQAQLAQFLHIGESVVARWELGHTTPTPAQLVKLCAVLGCKPRQLFGCCDSASIPVFDGEYIKLTDTAFDCSEKCGDFGIVLGSSLSPRFCKGDICYFTIGISADKDDVVFAMDKDCNGTVTMQKDVFDDGKIVAVCTALHQKL